MTNLIAQMDFPKQDDMTRHFGLVLIEREKSTGRGSRPEYVTWIKYLDHGKECAAGNYFDNLAAGYRDFVTRAERYIDFIERKQARLVEAMNQGKGNDQGKLRV